jgi:hypothetical protein
MDDLDYRLEWRPQGCHAHNRPSFEVRDFRSEAAARRFAADESTVHVAFLSVWNGREWAEARTIQVR